MMNKAVILLLLGLTGCATLSTPSRLRECEERCESFMKEIAKRDGQIADLNARLYEKDMEIDDCRADLEMFGVFK